METSEIATVSPTASRNFNAGMLLDVLLIDLSQTLYDDRNYCTLHFGSGQIDLNLDSWSQRSEKAETSAPIISQRVQLI